MRASTQDRIIERIERDTIRRLDTMQAAAVREVERLWMQTKRKLKTMIAYEYNANHKGGWTHTDAYMKGTIHRIARNARVLTNHFKHEAFQVFGRRLKEIYWESVYRHAYQLDVTTPPSFKVKLPKNPSFKEAMRIYSGPDAMVDYRERWSAWMDSYNSALEQNLRLGAINESTATDAMDEVDATRAGSPSFDVFDAMNRIMNAEAVSTASLGSLDVSSANDDLDVVEIWKARDWSRVCDDCDANDGLEIDEADGEIPLHPNCNCYYRLVPRAWAELLRSGDADDVELARLMDAQGRVPNSMLIKNDDGNLVGAVIVNFEGWMQDNAMVISSGGFE